MTAKTEPDGEYVTTRRAVLGVASFVAALPILIPGAITLAQVAGPAASNPFTTVPSNPWAIPSLKAHPRILLTPTRLARLQAQWANPDPNFVALKESWNITGSGTISAMASLVKYLATGSLTELTNAYNIAIAQTYSLYRGQVTMYADISPFVFDWGYADLTGTQKANLITQIESFNASRGATATNGATLAGWGQEQGYTGFTYGVLAIEGESGATSRLANLRNLLQNLCAWLDEGMGDGHWCGYPSEFLGMMNVMAFHIAGSVENLVTSRVKFIRNRSTLLSYRLRNNGWNYIGAPSHQKAITDGTIEGGHGEMGFMCAALADVTRNGLWQTMANNCANGNTTNKWGCGTHSDTLDATWNAFIFYDPTVTAISPSTLPNSKIFPLPGQVAFRGGWSQTMDVRGWLFSPLCQPGVHDTQYAGCVEIWRGDDMLICNEYTYAGQPCAWQNGYQTAGEVGTRSMCKSTLLFSPKGSSTPDRSGSQTQVKPAGSDAAYPISRQFDASKQFDASSKQFDANGGSWLAGTVSNFVYNGGSPGAMAQATADYGLAYPPSTVTSCHRIVAYVNGADGAHGTFFVQDNFVTVPGAVDRIRAFWGCRQKPFGMTNETVVTGSTAAGVLTYPNQPVVIRWGNSQATIQMVSPASVRLRLVGGGNGISGAPAGPGYESYFDGANLDYFANAQSGKTAAQYKRIQGCWRLECETTPAAAKGQMLFAITVGDIGSTAPTYTKTQVLGIMSPHGRVILVP